MHMLSRPSQPNTITDILLKIFTKASFNLNADTLTHRQRQTDRHTERAHKGHTYGSTFTFTVGKLSHMVVGTFGWPATLYDWVGQLRSGSVD